MGGRYDLEAFLDDVKAVLVTSLNGFIDALNTEKSDSITLAHVDATAGYFLQTLNTVPNVDPFVLYGVETPIAESIGPGTALSYRIFALVVFANEGSDPEVFRRLFRYQRAMLDLFRDKWGDLSRGGIRPKVAGLNPFPVFFKGLQNAIAAGVSLSIKME